MSHPNSPRVSPDSAAAMALSKAGQEKEHPSSANSDASDASEGTTGAATDSAPTSGSATPAAAPATSLAASVQPLIDQAQRWLQDSGLQNTLTQIPEPVKQLADQAAKGWRRLSTTQKVVGGAVLAASGWYLLSRGNSGARGSRGAQAATLHELLLFVNDRIEGYKRAASESQDPALISYYQQLVGQSQEFARKLNTYLRDKDHSTESSTTLKGKFYRAWMDTKAALTGYDEKAILGSNVYGEEWAIKAYEEALQDQTLTGALRLEVQRQYAQSKQTYQRLQQLQSEQ